MPIAVVLASDAFLGFYDPVVMAFVYIGFAMSALIGRAFLRRRRTMTRTGLCALATSLVFFIVSNFGCWVAGMYPHTADGLSRCYVMAIPWFGGTLLGDLLYTAVLFGIREAVPLWKGQRDAVYAA